MTNAHDEAAADGSRMTSEPKADSVPTCFALLGNPNTGKTTLYNRLCGVRSKTANFPGSTVEAHFGRLPAHTLGGARVVDLPGLYGLNLDRPESRTCRDYLDGKLHIGDEPEALVVVVDTTNLARNLVLVSQALQRGLPVVVALNLWDVSARRGDTVDLEALRRRLGCTVLPISARSGAGVAELLQAMQQPTPSTAELPSPTDARAAVAWAQDVVAECVRYEEREGPTITDRVDAVCTHPVLGLVVFAAVMTGLFYAIFALASVPMDLIELLFAELGGMLSTALPEGAIRDLCVDGIVAGVAGTLVFLPQICLLFFLISLLEDTGYLARAVFVMDRVLRAFGLPGSAFVPLLSAHACAIPAIMSARLIPDRNERLATILVTPFLSCSARLPVYVLLVGILFADRPLAAGLAFTGCYALGAVAALITALIARRTLLAAPPRPMMLELPDYRLPSLRTAFLSTMDRGLTFLRKAGTVIMGICVVLWWLSAYPAAPEPDAAIALRTQAEAIVAAAPDEPTAIEAASVEAASLEAEADRLASREAVARSFAGRISRVAAPVFSPLGADWQLTIGIVTSFAAREVFVSTLAVVFAGSDDADDSTVRRRIRRATRDDGSPLWTPSTAASLLVFYVLAMQCLPTLAVTAREAGGWKWAALQFGWMSAVAWVLAFVVRVGLRAAGVA